MNLNLGLGVTQIIENGAILVKFIKHNQNDDLKLDVSTSIRGLLLEVETSSFK